PLPAERRARPRPACRKQATSHHPWPQPRLRGRPLPGLRHLRGTGRRGGSPRRLAPTDTRRDNANAADGIITLRYGWTDVAYRPGAVAAEVARACSGAAGPEPCAVAAPAVQREPRRCGLAWALLACSATSPGNGPNIQRQPGRAQGSVLGDWLVGLAGLAGDRAGSLRFSPGHGLEVAVTEEADQDASAAVVPGNAGHDRDLAIQGGGPGAVPLVRAGLVRLLPRLWVPSVRRTGFPA